MAGQALDAERQQQIRSILIMAYCKFPNCKNFQEPSKKKGATGEYCSDHLTEKQRRQGNAHLRKQKEDEQKAQEQRRRDEVAQKQANKQEELKRKKAQAIVRHQTEWNRLINRVVDEVIRLRQTDPKANAGKNDVGNTRGGTSNPLELLLTGETHGIKKADVLRGMAGFESSDSGLYKFRRKEVLVHCC